MRNRETIVDDIGIKMYVDYDYTKLTATLDEVGYPSGRIQVEKLVSVSVMFIEPGHERDGREIEILPLLHPDEIELIISQLNYDL